MPTVALILATLWVLGCVSSLTMGGGIHVFMLLAVGIMATRLIWGRKAAL